MSSSDYLLFRTAKRIVSHTLNILSPSKGEVSALG